jgi:hypothetical protein
MSKDNNKFIINKLFDKKIYSKRTKLCFSKASQTILFKVFLTICLVFYKKNVSLQSEKLKNKI